MIKVNGTTTVEASDLKPAAGKLWIQCEGAELLIRRWELWPLGNAPKLEPHRRCQDVIAPGARESPR